VRVKLGIVADIHGNDVALRAVLKDAERWGVDRWWALGDLVLFGPRPVDVLELLLGLPGIGMVRGNTDRYVLTGEQPAPHATAADAAGNIGLVERYAAMAAGIAWTCGVLDQADLLDVLTGSPGAPRCDRAHDTLRAASAAYRPHRMRCQNRRVRSRNSHSRAGRRGTGLWMHSPWSPGSRQLPEQSPRQWRQ